MQKLPLDIGGVKRALYEPELGHLLVDGRVRKLFSGYVVIAPAMSGTLAMILSKRFSSVSHRLQPK